MCSRPANDDPALSSRPGSPGRTIAARLAAAFAVATVILLAGAGVFLYDGLHTGLEEEDQALIADKIRLLRLIMNDESRDAGALRTELRLEGGLRRFNPYFARVLDAGGNVTVETPGMSELLPLDVFPEPVPDHREPTRGSYWTAADGSIFLMLAADVRPVFASGTKRTVQAAIDVSEEFKLLADYRRRLVATLAVGILISVLVGIVIARRGLRPIGRMTDAVRRITPSRLHKRVGAAGWPAELAGLAEAFDEMLERLEESFDRLGRFSDDIAHELRTPINNILGQTEVALNRARSNSASREVLESNLEEIRRIAAVIDSLLFLARADHAVTPLKRASFEIRPVLESTVDLYSPVAEELGVRLRCEGGGLLTADENLFRRAVSNLTSNALAFVESGGEVSLSATTDTHGTVIVRVRDTGIGISAQDAQRIFDRFYRVLDSRGRSREGTGLGLAIVRSIMELHGGTIEVESREGHGSTFELRFPASSARS